MKPFNWRVPLGVVLVVLGVLAFLQSFNILNMRGEIWLLAFGLIFAAVGVSFIYALIADHNAWWAAIPGMTLLGLGVMMVLFSFPSISLGALPPFIFLGSIAAAFWLIYYLKRSNFWWAIIPAGVMTTIAIIVFIPEGSSLGGSVFFLGMAATFALLGFVEINGRRMTWPWIPAGVLAVMGVLIGLTTSGWSAIVWAVLLILAGAFLVARPYLMKK